MSKETIIDLGTKIHKPLDSTDKNYFYAHCAVWCNENGADLLDMGEYYEICARKLPDLGVFKQQRESELNTLHIATEHDAHIFSSLGFAVDANDRANRDIAGLLVTTPENATVIFMDYENQAHTVSRADLEVLQKEIIENAQYLYRQKWQYRSQIEACETSKDLSQLEFKFEYKNFTAVE